MRRCHSIDEVLRQSEFVSLHVPLVDKTRHLIDAKRLASAHRGLVLLNFSRDAIVDEEAVAAALADKRLGRYVTDFPSPRLQGNANVLALPHLGASTEEAEENCALMVVDSLRDFLEQGTIRNSVNFPAVEMARESPYRIAIANANVPNMGSIVFPDAPLKVFLTADVATRAERRHKQLMEKGMYGKMDDVVEELRRRDERDSSRPVAPLKHYPDAVFLDTTSLGIDEAVDRILRSWAEKSSQQLGTGESPRVSGS